MVLNRLALRPKDGPQTSKPEGWSSSGSAPRRETMPAIASLEDLKVAQRDGRSKFLIVTPCLPDRSLGVGRRLTLDD